MNFKLLAIRPLEKCDRTVLKELVPNCIYQFYNEYDFYYKNDIQQTEVKSYIEFQESNIAKELPLKYEPIYAVKKTEQVPKRLFAENINVSAIVGKNGSGKSSILELFYYLMYKYAIKHNLVSNKTDLKSNKRLEIEVFYEDEHFNIVKHTYTEQENSILKYELKEEGFYCLSEKAYSDLLNYECYSIALNYSIYGLNSRVSGNWLDSLFHKNDGYRTPIVINPYREDGNIDINNEYVLAQSRLLLNYFLINNNSLLEDVQISKVEFQLPVFKHQYVSKYIDKSKQEIYASISVIYRNLINSNSYVYGKLLKDTELNSLVSKVLKRHTILEYKDGKFRYKNLKEKESAALKKMFTDSRILFPEFKVLNVLYILKKIYKITQNYNEYNIFRPLFIKKGLDPELFEPNLSSVKVTKSDLSIIYGEYFYRIFKKLVEDYFKSEEIVLIDNTLIPDDKKYKIINYLMNLKFGDIRRAGIHSRDNFTGYFDIIVNGYFDVIGNGYLDISSINLKNKQIIGVINSALISNIENNQKYNLKETVQSTIDQMLGQMSRKYIEVSIPEMNNLLFMKLYADDSHVTFKLKQAISYFSEGFFENIKSFDWDAESELFNIGLKQTYLEKRSIKTMPLAFVQPTVLVVKTKEKDPIIIERLVKSDDLSEYPFNELSSGEQQLIHSILTVVYHLFNLRSIESEHKQTNINLIFDEIELYFHPEFQRLYISNLISALKGFDKNKDLKFNILLSTHSPFILSDIPTQNILKLKKSVPSRHEDGKNSFGANIHDLLADEFYLEQGFMGQFVNNEINNVAKFLQAVAVDNKDNFSSNIKRIRLDDFPDYDQKYCKKIINLIGEPILYLSLMELYNKAFKEDSKKMIKSQIAKLKQLLRDENNTY